MTDREKFKENLNYYLNHYGKMQKDLAEYVGAKTTTVSGWTRGVSYPRSDAMEKIAAFFGIPTSRLVGKREDEESEPAQMPEPKSDDIRLFIKGLSKLSPEQIEQAKDVFRAMFIKTVPDLFEKGDNDDDT